MRNVSIAIFLMLLAGGGGYYGAIIRYANTEYPWVVFVPAICFGLVLIGNWIRRKFLQAIGIMAVVGLLLLYGGVSIYPKAVSEESQEADTCLLVPAGGLMEGALNEESINRLNRALEIWNGTSTILCCGGEGEGESIECYLMRQYLISKGVPEELIMTEGQSKDTNENMKNALQILGDKPVQIVTGDYHVLRSYLLAKAAGFTKVSLTAAKDTSSLFVYNTLRECGALIRDLPAILLGN